jgi:hypothetical protein
VWINDAVASSLAEPARKRWRRRVDRCPVQPRLSIDCQRSKRIVGFVKKLRTVPDFDAVELLSLGEQSPTL